MTTFGFSKKMFVYLNYCMLALVWYVLGCNQPALIDRTQPNSIQKSDLLNGSWYIQESIVDVPKTPNMGVAIPGYSGKMEKIRWTIQEDLLVAYRTYEIIPGADPRVDRKNSRIGDVKFLDGRPYRGDNPVFAYRIDSHFDRQRQYNASTGEQTNVLEENTTDRPWYERAYMRVNWAANVAQNLDSLCTHCPGRNASLALRYVTEQDQQPKDQAMTFERNSQDELIYFDWISQVIVDPPRGSYGGVTFPFCWSDSTVDCQSIDVRMRVSVKKVNTERVQDYEPLVYSDRLNKKFGMFRQVAYSYTRDYEYTYTGVQYFGMRHNIWHAARDDEGKYIPVTQRALRPIVYYMTQNTPDYLKQVTSRRHANAANLDSSKTVEASWDSVFRRTIAIPRGLETDDIPQMFYVCDSPVREGAPEACGPVGTYARMGDLRFNLIPYIEQSVGGLLGLGPASMDPETGEVVHAAANVYGVTLDAWAGQAMQVIDLLNGEISFSQLLAGEDIRDYVADNLITTHPRSASAQPVQNRQLRKNKQALFIDAVMALPLAENSGNPLRSLFSKWQTDGLPVVNENRKATVKKLLEKHPSIKTTLVNLPEVRLAMQNLAAPKQFAARLKSDKAFYEAAALDVLLGENPLTKAREVFKNTSHAEIGCFYEVYDDEDFLAIARRKRTLQQQLETQYMAQGHTSCATPSACTAPEAKKLSRDEVYNSLRREAYRSVAEHEIGHTLGMTHNFIASADALNYQDGYWDLRKETIGVDREGRRVLPITPRGLLEASKLNDNQKDAGLHEYTYSSIMDYGARLISLNKGVGKYDVAFALFTYAGGHEPGWVEVFNETRMNYAQPDFFVETDDSTISTFKAYGAHVEIPLAHASHYTSVSKFYTDKYHYSTLPLHFADRSQDFMTMIDAGIERMHNRSYRPWREMQKYYEQIEASVKEWDLSYTQISGTYSSRRSTLLAHAEKRLREAGLLTANEHIPVEVPYMYCPDQVVGANVLCNKNDQGADIYEITSKWIEVDKNIYPFLNFRRGKLNLSPFAVVSRRLSRSIGNFPNIYQQWLYNIYLIIEGNDGAYAMRYAFNIEPSAGDLMWIQYWTMAVIDSLNYMMGQFTSPAVGYYGQKTDNTWEYTPNGDPKNLRLPAPAEAEFINTLKQRGYVDVLYLPRGQGRSTYTLYDTDGYLHFSRINEVGLFWDHFPVLAALTASDTTFLGVDRGADALRYSLPYYMTFPEELTRLFSAHWTGNTSYFSPYMAKRSDGTGHIQRPTFVRAENYLPSFIYPLKNSTPMNSNDNTLQFNKVQPVVAWSNRYNAQFMTMSSFNVNFDYTYAQLNNVFRMRKDADVVPAAGYEIVRCVDPFGGGYIYAALKKLDDSNPSPAAYMVELAQEYSEKWTQAKGNPPATAPQIIDGLNASQWEEKLRDVVRSMEIMRIFYAAYGSNL